MRRTAPVGNPRAIAVEAEGAAPGGGKARLATFCGGDLVLAGKRQRQAEQSEELKGNASRHGVLLDRVSGCRDRCLNRGTNRMKRDRPPSSAGEDKCDRIFGSRMSAGG